MSSDSGSQAHLSDDEDISDVKPAQFKSMPLSNRDSNLAKNREAVAEVCAMLRDDPLLPLKPASDNVVFEDVDTLVLLPSWHWPFPECAACGLTRYQKNTLIPKPGQNSMLPMSNSFREAWAHIWGSKYDIGQHRVQLSRVVDRKFPEFISREESRMSMALTLVEEALAEKRRVTVEVVGVARDRRTLNCMHEVMQSDNCKTHMCFICNSKHIYYQGLDAFGEEYNAGCIDYRNKDQDRAHFTQSL